MLLDIANVPGVGWEGKVTLMENHSAFPHSEYSFPQQVLLALPFHSITVGTITIQVNISSSFLCPSIHLQNTPSG